MKNFKNLKNRIRVQFAKKLKKIVSTLRVSRVHFVCLVSMFELDDRVKKIQTDKWKTLFWIICK